MGWIVIITALVLMSTILADDPISKSFVYVSLLGWGIGFVVFIVQGLSPSDAVNFSRGRMLTATPMYPIQAPLPVSHNAPALAFMWFLRSFASVSISIPL